MVDPSRILIISEGNFPDYIKHVQYYQLNDKSINIAEYDIVIINLVNLTEFDAKTLYDEESIVNVKKVHDLLWSNKRLVLITDGITTIELGDRVHAYTFSFLPFKFPITNEIGEVIIVDDKAYREYYEKNVNNWKFYLKDEGRFDKEMAAKLLKQEEYNSIYRTEWSSEKIASNNFRRYISFSVRYGYYNKYNNNKILSGPVTFLQAPDKTNIESAIRALLSIFGVEVITPAPTWVAEYKIPKEEETLKEIKDFEKEKLEIDTKIKDTEEKLLSINRFKKLLFETGNELKEIVWDTLEEIGFKINREDKGKEDGSIEEGKETILLEIKGKEGSTARADLRQIDDWISNYLAINSMEPKGLFIINHDRFKKPHNRIEPFPSDVIKYLENNKREIIAMTTIQLFDIYCKVKEGKLNADTIRKKIISTKGIFK